MSATTDPPAPGQGHRPVTFDEVVLASGRRDLARLPALVRQAFRLVWSAAPRPLALTAAMQLLAGISLAGQLFIMRRLLQRVLATDGVPALSDLAFELVAFASLSVIVALASLTQREQQNLLGILVERHTTAQVMDVSTAVDLIEFDRPSFFDRLQRARVNAGMRPLQIASGIVGLLGSGAAVLAVGAALLILEPVIVAIVVVGAIPSLITNRLSSRLYHGFAVRQIAGDRRRAYLYDLMCRKDEAHEIRAFDSSDHLRKEHDRLYEAKVADLRGVLRRRMIYGTVNALVTTLITVGSLVLLLVFVRIGRIPFTDAAVALGGLLLVAGRLRGLVASSGSLYEGALFLQDFTDFIDAGRELTARTSEPTEASGPFGSLTLERVSFTYPSRTEPSLQQVSLTLGRGEVIALVGENGSGKTTLAKLLAGLYEPTEGIMRWDGRDVRELDRADLRAHCTVIFQDFARYFVTAHENIAISRIDRMGDREAVRDAAATAGAGAFLSALPQGYDTLLGPSFVGGSDLSLGQWQRIALARAYFRESPLLILDEPTASLDPRGEYEIFQQVRQFAGDRTVVLISHRFSNVRDADRILVLRGGRIVEQGSHDMLMSRRGGLYHELFTLQAEGYQSRPV